MKRTISADAADIPVKPRMPAMIDTTKKISAHFRIVIAAPPALAASRPLMNRRCNGGAWNWFHDDGGRLLASMAFGPAEALYGPPARLHGSPLSKHTYCRMMEAISNPSPERFRNPPFRRYLLVRSAAHGTSRGIRPC